jgi:hypothetical protein
MMALEALIAKARNVHMTEEEVREQRRSFVYGNTHIENDMITREMVAEADEKITREELPGLDKGPDSKA